MSNFIAISDARANLPKIVEKVSRNLDRIFITVKGQPKVVVISAEELESIEETAEIIATPGALASIKKGEREAKKGLGKPLKDLLI